MYEKQKHKRGDQNAKTTEKQGQRAREDFKTLNASWYKPQSYKN